MLTRTLVSITQLPHLYDEHRGDRLFRQCQSLRVEIPQQSTDHELIPARNVSLAAMQGARAEVMFVTIQRENTRPSKKEINKAVTMLIIKITLQWLR
jgi:hypothetical protein